MHGNAHPYYESFSLIERLHRHFLDVVKVVLEKNSIQDVNNVQAMILYSIGDEDLTVGELTLRGYYLGSNVSYNVKKLVETGYLTQERSMHDKRAIRLKLTDKAQKLGALMGAAFDSHVGALGNFQIADGDLKQMNDTLKKIERFWTVALTQGV
ncbi:MAG: MarR family winged helix-turn-helix transcriptional regulator [Bdellovibrionales bacterium]